MGERNLRCACMYSQGINTDDVRKHLLVYIYTDIPTHSDIAYKQCNNPYSVLRRTCIGINSQHPSEYVEYLGNFT